MERNYKIYMHKNKINGKAYIGQTYRELHERFGCNGSRYDGCPVFYKAILKYGWDNFEHILLEENISSQNEANEKEKYYIALYNSTDRKYGYNVRIGGCENKAAEIPVYEYSLDGSYIAEHPSRVSAGVKFGAENGCHISQCCNGERQYAYGRQWRDYKIDHIDPVEPMRINSPIIQLSLDGEYIKKYNSTKDASATFPNTDKAYFNIANCLQHDSKSAYGYIWIYEDEYDVFDINNYVRYSGLMRQMNQYSKDGVYIKTFPSAAESARDVKGFPQNIINCANGKQGRKTAYGYIWKWADEDDLSLCA